MRHHLLELLYCPNCRDTCLDRLDLTTRLLSDDDILEGFLQCSTCKTVYEIRDGILDLLWNPHPTILSHQEVVEELDSSKVIWDFSSDDYEQRLLALPDGSGSPTSFKYDSMNWHQMLSMLNLTGEEIVLDIGADTCWSTSYFAELGCSCVSVDIVRNHLKLGQVFFRHRSYFERVLADMCILPFQDSVFDLVFRLFWNWRGWPICGVNPKQNGDSPEYREKDVERYGLLYGCHNNAA